MDVTEDSCLTARHLWQACIQSRQYQHSETEKQLELGESSSQLYPSSVCLLGNNHWIRVQDFLNRDPVPGLSVLGIPG